MKILLCCDHHVFEMQKTAFQRWTCKCISTTLLYHSHYVFGEN